MSNMKKMFNENTKLVYEVYSKKIAGRKNADIMKDDLIQIGMLSLWKSCTWYDPEKGVKFSTYAFNSIYKSMLCALVRETKRTALLVSMNKQVKSKTENSVITYEDVIASSVSVASEVEIDCLVKQITDAIGNNSNKVIDMIRKGYTQVDIAKEMSTTRAEVSSILKKFRKKLKNTLFFEE